MFKTLAMICTFSLWSCQNHSFGSAGYGGHLEDLGEIWERFWRGLGIRANKHEFQDGSKTVTGVCHGEEDRKAFDIFV